MRRVFFLKIIILLCEEGKLIILLLTRNNYWPSGCLAIACSIKKCFSVTMASRFEIADEEYIEGLKDKS